MPEKTKHEPLLSKGEFKVEKVVELNFFDMTGKKAGTSGTSNKSYHAEYQVSNKDDRAQIYTMWGPTGGNQTEDWRHYSDKTKALKEFESIIKSKIRKGYKEIDIAQRAYGSDEAKQITKAVTLKNTDGIKDLPKSKLHNETQRLITNLMGSTNQFVIQTLKCPLGQLTNQQIDAGRARLKEAKDIVDKHPSGIPAKGKDYNRIEDLTNDFYALIPHNLGSGARGQMSHLLLDSAQKIYQKEDDLDTLLDAKSIGAVLKTGSNIDDQYKVLNADFDFIDHSDPIFSWLEKIVLETRASNHSHLGKIKVLNTWKLKRNNESEAFLKRAEDIANEYGKHVVPPQLEKHVKARTDLTKELESLYKRANINPLFHGTKTQNLTGIIKNGLLIRPAGVALTGAMYGNSIYFGFSTKSINYTSINSSYWAGGNDDVAYLFLNDCALGNQKIANGSYQYTKKNIAPHHSVWARGGGYSGVINDEFMLYDTNQHNMRYLIEFTCKAR